MRGEVAGQLYGDVPEGLQLQHVLLTGTQMRRGQVKPELEVHVGNGAGQLHAIDVEPPILASHYCHLEGPVVDLEAWQAQSLTPQPNHLVAVVVDAAHVEAVADVVVEHP